MSQNATYLTAAESSPVERSRFLRRTYTHLAGAILLFTIIETFFQMSPIAAAVTNVMVGSKYSWLLVLGAFMIVSWVAQTWAQSGASLGMQYAGLILYVVAEAVIFIPLLLIAQQSAPNLIAMAGMITIGLFLGLTAVVMLSGVNFSFLRSVMVIGGFIALGVIAASIVFGFSLGIVFSGAMVIFAAIAILYNTSGVFNEYRTDQHVAASLSLFASIALLFWYILQILMSRR